MHQGKQAMTAADTDKSVPMVKKRLGDPKVGRCTICGQQSISNGKEVMTVETDFVRRNYKLQEVII